MTTITPVTVDDLLSNIGGSLGLYLGGSLFSFFEFTGVVILLFVSAVNGIFKICNKLKVCAGLC